LPEKYPLKSTVHDWYQTFVRDGIFDETFGALVEVLESNGEIDINTAAVDATFIRSRAGSQDVGKTKCGKGQKLMAIVDQKSRPVALFLSSAQPHEITLLKQTLDALKTEKNPRYLLADGAYDSDPMDEDLRKIGINLIAPHKKNRKKPKTQDGRQFIRYKKRWVVERFFAHLHNYRKLTINYDKNINNFLGYIKLASAILIAQKLFKKC
jgi:transposase